MDRKATSIRIYDLAAVIAGGLATSVESSVKPLKQIDAANQNEFNCAVWGPLNKTLYVATKAGKI